MYEYANIFTILNFFFAAVIGIYFLKLLLSQNNTKSAINKKAHKELDKLRYQCQIKLSEPLSEQTRPQTFGEIIGQDDGVKLLRAALCGPNPQHILIYGPPGVGKTAAARLVLEEAKQSISSPFRHDAQFIEVDAATSRFDERGIADPLIGSVHDPIYQGAGPMGVAGIPQPKPGAVTKAHGGILFIDEIGELHGVQINKLLKVLEDRKVYLESAYYSSDNKNIPEHIHYIFKNGLPADFRLIGATTRSPQEIPAAIRSRCLEVYFRSLTASEIVLIARNACNRINFGIEEQAIQLISRYAKNGREAVNLVQISAGLASVEGRREITTKDMEWLVNCSRLMPRLEFKVSKNPQIGVAYGLAVYNGNNGAIIEVEASVIRAKAGRGQIKVSGIIAEEEFGGSGHTIRRQSMAKDSVENVVTVLRKDYQMNLQDYDVHINFAGGIPLDGPSAGVTIATALYSAAKQIPIRSDVVMTGEISLKGRVKPVGGVVDKLRAAFQHPRVGTAIIPLANWQESFADYCDLKVVPVHTLKEVFNLAFAQIEDTTKAATASDT